jgi:murein DD-endopeptidase MepM/ murein hydrolase activator NlpD
MSEMQQIIASYSEESIHILEMDILLKAYTLLDLSTTNQELAGIDIADFSQCQQYIDDILNDNKTAVAYGGYLERRALYRDKLGFETEGSSRNIHLGIDFWTKAGTKVLAPLKGKVHSFKNNSTFGDYGPTIILQHKIVNLSFFTLYGHLSLESLEEVHVGKVFKKGEMLATLGTPDINVGYAPHLHFQIIHDLEGYIGDYPGVCSEREVGFYSKNCPNPNLLLKIRP